MKKGQNHIILLYHVSTDSIHFLHFPSSSCSCETYFPLFFSSSSSLFKTYFGKGANKLTVKTRTGRKAQMYSTGDKGPHDKRPPPHLRHPQLYREEEDLVFGKSKLPWKPSIHQVTNCSVYI